MKLSTVKFPHERYTPSTVKF